MTDRTSALAGAVQGEPLGLRGLLAAIGGPFGIVESVVPPLVFVVLYQVAAIGAAPHAVARSALLPIVVVPLACSAVLLAYRMLRKQKAGAAIAGAIVVAVSALLVLVTGDANANYVPGFFINGAYGLAFLVSLLVGRPLVGVAAGALMQQGDWRADRRRRRLFAWLTAAWVALFGIRLAVELPLFFAGHQVVALGIARIVLGVPLYALVLVITVLGAQAALPRRAVVVPSDG